MTLASWTLHIAPRDAAAVLAQILAASRKPATLVLQELAGVELGIDIQGSGERPLTTPEACRLEAPGIVRCNWRTALLETPSGLTAATTALTWLPARLPWVICEELNAGLEPAGVILSQIPGGMQRIDRRAMAMTGTSEAVRSSAVLVAGGIPVGIAEEHITLAFASLLAG